MTFFTEHSTLLIIMLLIIVVGTFFLLLGYALCKMSKLNEQEDEIREREYLKKLTKDFHKPNIEEY